MKSASCKALSDEADAGNHEPGFGSGDGSLEILGDVVIAAEPGECALDYRTKFYLE